MGSLIPSDLSLDCRFLSAPKASSIGEFLTDVSRIHNASERIAKLDDYVDRLEVEMKKIEAFKRELPLCMILLNDAIVKIRVELVQCKKLFSVPVFEEFMPLKKSTEEKDVKIENNKEKDVNNGRDKMNWMSSVQLWSSDNQHHNLNSEFSHKQNLKLDKLKVVKEETNRAVMDGIFRRGKNRVVENTFFPFKGCANFHERMMKNEDRDELNVDPRLSLGIPESKNLREEINSSGFSSKSSCSRSGSSSGTNDQSNIRTGQQSHQTARKQRRCWSPELHRRFVNALQQLGGAQAATPKQIRELMQVDGLSNDEVKSHLQKYRLHTRRVPPTTNTSTNQPAVLGGLWMPQEQCGESSKQSNSQSRSPQGHMHLARSSRGTSLAGGDSMGDEDDEKSESQSWKNQIQLSRRNDV